MKKTLFLFLFLFSLLLLFFVNYPISDTKLKAFPSAEGGGANSIGGRNGRVIAVTNLNNEGRGSLREACETNGSRTVIFRVGGTIDLKGNNIIIKNDYLTIAGQSAPGEGIQIKNGGISVRASEVIIRYLRIRPGPASASVDALNIKSPNRYDRKKNIIIDHVSAFWGVDETMNAGSFSDNVTIQWSIIAEGLHCSSYDGGKYGEQWKPCKVVKGKNIWEHSRGSMISEDSRNISFHHNILYRNYKRNPLVQSSDIDAINNVIVNYQYQVFIQPFKAKVRANFIGNYFRSYIHKRPPIRVFNNNKGYDGNSSIYYEDNYDAYFRPQKNENQTNIRILHTPSNVDISDGYVEDRIAPHDFSPIKRQTVHEAYVLVLANAGTVYPKRDEADTRVVNFIKSGKAPKTFVNDPSEVGGWPNIASSHGLKDSDNDGIPDTWEIENKLNPNNFKDGNKKNLSSLGYTNIEVYLNSLIFE
ncbi:MAG: COG3866 Pectate lyase [uncultured Sulfurovum sp.]|uniref:COG3866 Pectate lyase n=1 Tax=uncultured Sulfurovum sp. TaxID=269237 RepID=A0A6S6TUQ2_9BACT|nr:MAG: COG3866 Pectate lyase [uncultured Sulfurovum sp.]